MKTLKRLFIIILVLGASTGFAGVSDKEHVHYNRFVKSMYYGDKILGFHDYEVFGKEFKEEMMTGIYEYCTTRDLNNYKQKLDSFVPRRRIKTAKIASGVVGAVSGTAAISAFFLKNLSKISKVGTGVAGVIASAAGAGIIVGVGKFEKYFYDDSNFELKKSLEIFCALIE